MRRAIVRWLETSRGSGIILIVLLLALWQFSAVYVMDTPTWPPVTRIFAAWYENVADGTLIMHLLATLWRQMLGYSLAVTLGITLGLAMGYYRILNNLFEPLVEVFRPIPGPAYLPVLVLFVGIGSEMKVVLVMIASLFPILLNTYGGVRAIDPVQLDTARTLGLTTAQTMREVVLPVYPLLLLPVGLAWGARASGLTASLAGTLLTFGMALLLYWMAFMMLMVRRAERDALIATARSLLGAGRGSR